MNKVLMSGKKTAESFLDTLSSYNPDGDPTESFDTADREVLCQTVIEYFLGRQELYYEGWPCNMHSDQYVASFYKQLQEAIKAEGWTLNL
ncbi:hypothetical protein [Neptuniibacter sp. QD37_11]|uniref:hypothetical protein n=1 Tax=Neptuniibacter sp. QD37_11 TaxID=3398209 RepID=UPI0039F5CB34